MNRTKLLLVFVALIIALVALPAAAQTVTVSSPNASEGAGVISFLVSVSGFGGSPVNLTCTTVPGTALDGPDYTGISTVATVPDGGSTLVTVPVIDDATVEGYEQFSLSVSASDGTFVQRTGSGTATIVDDDSTTVSVTAPLSAVTEGNSGTTNATFAVSLSNPSDFAVTVDYTTSSGTAIAGADFTPTTGTLTIPPGSTTATINVPVIGDTLYEGGAAAADETFTLTLSNPQNATAGTMTATGAIDDDDAQPTISVTDAAVTEGETASFYVSLSGASSQTTTVDYTTTNGTATTADSDYTTASGTLTFNPGETSKLVTVATTSDTKFEADETYTLDLSNATNATIADAQGAGTIVNDDTPPSVSIADASATEGSNITFTISIPTAAGVAITGTLSTSNGTATAGSDYTAAAATAWSIAAGTTSTTVSVATATDSLFEANETFFADITTANGVIADGTGTGTIVDGSGLPSLSINSPASVTEGTDITFTVTLSAVSGNTVTVNYATNNGTATSGEDFMARSGTLTFAPGVTTQSIVIPTVDDTIDEAQQNFTVTLSNASNASVSTATGTGLIDDNDGAPNANIGDVAVGESTGPATFLVTLDKASQQTITINYATAGGTATSGTDFTAASGTLTFNPGELSKTIDVAITSDSTIEGSETFTMTLSSPSNVTLGTSVGSGTIVDDDNGLPTISIGDASQNEGNVGTTAMTFPVTLSATTGSTVTVNYTVTPNTAQATAPADYSGTLSGTLTFNAGSVTPTTPLTVTINGDSTYENNETFTVTLSAPSANAILADATATGTILNDDTPPQVVISDASATEGSSAIVNVTLLQATEVPVTVYYRTAGNTATEGVDYTGFNGGVGFPAGTSAGSSMSLSFATTADTTYEGNETFLVWITGSTNAFVADNQGVVTITNDDTAPTVSISGPASIGEAGGPANYTVTLSAASGLATTVDYVTNNGTASAGSDFSYRGGTLTIPAGSTSTTFAPSISVPIVSDTLTEANETFSVDLSNPTNATIGTGSVVTTIVDDDAATAPTVSVDNATATEGAGASLQFHLYLSSASGVPVNVGYSTTSGTAVSGSDFVGTAGSVTFAPGETVKTVTVSILNDSVSEPNETMYLTISGPSVNLAASTGTGTIIDDDPAAPTVFIDNVAVSELNSGTSSANFTISLTSPATTGFTVNYTTSDGTATGGPAGTADYDTTTGSIAFAAGESNKSIPINVNGDTLDEDDETFFVTLTGIAGCSGCATVPPGSRGMATIIDNDALPALSINTPANVGEAAGSVTFTVTLTPQSGRNVTVHYTTVDGSAITGQDYTAVNGDLTFLPGETTKSVVVPVTNDLLDEANENFTVLLSNPGNATISTASGTGTIVDNDTAPNVRVDNVSVAEDLGSAIFRITLEKGSGRTVTVNYATAGNTATDGVDYTSTTGSVIFRQGETVKTVEVPITPDTTIEGNEQFFLNLTSATNGVIAASAPLNRGIGTIVDDDGQPALTINTPAAVTEGGNIAFTVTLAPASAQTVTVAYNTSDGTATIASGDYDNSVDPYSSTLTFAPGETTKTVTIHTIDDSTDEPNENFYVTLSSPTNATIATAQGTATILDNDGGPTIDIDNATVVEGNSGTTPAVFTVVLSKPSQVPVTVTYNTADGTATTADSDYVAVSGGTLTFAPGETSKTIVISVNGDTITEPNENYTVTLSAPVNGVLGIATATGIITNDDGAPTLSINDVSLSPEGNSGTSNLTFTVTLAGVTNQTVTVNYATADDSANAPDDYSSVSGQLTFAPGELTKTIDVPVVGDVYMEPNETFFVNLTNATNATIADAQGIGTIVNDDTVPDVAINDVTLTEGNYGQKAFTFTVTLTAPAEQIVTVDYATADGTAQAGGGTSGGDDYQPASGTLTFAPGVTTQTVTVLVNGDLMRETNQTFFVNLSNATNAAIADSQAVGTINNDDPIPSFNISDASVVEGQSGQTALTFTVTMSNPRQGNTLVDFATADNTATTADGDYNAASGTLTFATGETSKTVTVMVNGDPKTEADETMFVNLSNPNGGTIADGQGIGTIKNDDDVPLVLVDNTVVGEGAGTATLNVTLSHPSDQTITVNFATVDDSALAGSDYTGTSGTLTFNPGTTTPVTPLTVGIIDDSDTEPTETFFVSLSGASNALIGTSQATVTITDNEAAPVISLAQTTTDPVTEGNSGPTAVTYTVTLDRASASSITVDYSTAAGTATADVDFATTSGTLTFLPGETSKTFTVNILGDTIDEDDETFDVSVAGHGATGTPSVTTTIADDDATPVVSINDVSVTEPDSNPNPTVATFTLTLSNPSENALTVDVTVNDGTAGAGVDYTAPASNPTTITFAAGEVEKTFSVAILGDTDPETNETFDAVMSNASAGLTIDADTTGTATIVDNDSKPTLSVVDASAAENAGPMTFRVNLSVPITTDVNFTYHTVDGSAHSTGLPAPAGADFTAITATSATIPAGSTYVDLPVTINDDIYYEGNETLSLVIDSVDSADPITSAPNATISDGTGLGTIIEDEHYPQLAINDIAAAEGTGAGTTPFTFTVTVTPQSATPISFNWNTAFGTASGADFTAVAPTTVNLPAATASTTVTVDVAQDDMDEADEYFDVVLSSPVGAELLDGSGRGTIQDDDAASVISVATANSPATEGVGVVGQFTITLDRASSLPITVSYATAAGTATEGVDYQATSGQVTFNPGETSVTVGVPLIDDSITESDETFDLVLSAPSNGTFGTSSATFTIQDDDSIPTVSITSPIVSEPDVNPNPVTADFVLTLSHPSVNQIDVDVTVNDGTATAGTDYTAPASNPTTITFAPGETTKTFSVAILGDTTAEANETFTAVMSSTDPDVTISSNTGTATIVDNDSVPTVSAHDLTVNENVGTAQVNVTLSIPIDTPVTVEYTLGDPSTDTAVGGFPGSPDFDYEFDGSTTHSITFNPGETVKTIDVPITDDLLYESQEFFTVNLGTVTGAAVMGNNKSFVTIVDNEPQPRLSIADLTVDESVGNADFTVTMSAVSPYDVEFDVITTDGSAKVTSDYNSPSVVHFTIPAGSTTATVSVPIIDDNFKENAETFYVNVVNPVNALIGDGQAIGTITDNDALPCLSIDDVTMRELDSGTQAMVFTISLSAPTEQIVSVKFRTADNTATAAGPDYHAAAGTALIPPGETSTEVTVLIDGDTVMEPDETFFVNLSSPSANATICDSQGVGTILDDEVNVVTTASPNPAFTFESVTITVTVNHLGSAVPTGNVDFYDGATLLGSAPVDGSAVAVLAHTFNTIGNHPLVGHYVGDVNYNSGDGNLALVEALLGSLDNDNDVDGIDLVLLQQYIVGNIAPGSGSFTNPRGADAGDLNRDGFTNGMDLVIMQQYIVGNVASLPY